MSIRSLLQLLTSLGSLWRYATRDWLRLTEPSEDKNRSRWPTHLLWESISGIEWEGNEPVLLSRYSHRRVPREDYFYKEHFRLVTGYMAREGIAAYDEACRRLASYTRSFHEGHCFDFIGIPFEQLVDEKVAFKARQYNTRLNASPKRNDAEEYRRQSDGE